MNQKKKQSTNPKMSIPQQKKFEDAKKSYDKMFKEIAPFTPKVTASEVSTEGKWKSNSSLSFC